MTPQDTSAIQNILLPEANITLREDGIVHVYIYANTNITVEFQSKLVEAYETLLSYKCPFIFECGEFVSISKKARENAILIEESTPVSASAVITLNLGQKILADYYYRFNKPKLPLKVFRNFDDGIAWIKTLDSYSPK